MSILGTVAAAATFYFTGGNLQLTAAAYSIGSGVDAALNAPDSIGPRLEDLRVQLSSYGAPIPFEWGVNRHAGTIIWPRDLSAVEHRQETSSKGGPDIIKFTYTLSCAVLVCEGPIAGIRRIWANKKIVYDVSSGNAGKTQDPRIGSVRIYLGNETQQADPLIEAADGPSPAYRGYAYVVFEGYDVTDLHGRPPQWEFEVLTAGTAIRPQAPVYLGNSGAAIPVYSTISALVDRHTGLIYSLSSGWVLGGNLEISVNSDVTQTRISSFSISSAITAPTCCGLDLSSISFNYAELLQGPEGVIVACSSGTYQFDVFYKISADGLTVSGPHISTSIELCGCPPTYLPAPSRVTNQHGTAVITATYFDVAHNAILCFGYGGTVRTVGPTSFWQGGSFAIGEGYGGSLGPTISIPLVLATPTYFCAFYFGSSSGVILRRLDDYSFHAQYACESVQAGQGTAFYDRDRNRLIINANDTVAPFDYQIIDIAAGTMTSHTFAAAVGADASPAPSRSIRSAVYANGKYIFGATAISGTGTTLYIVDPVSLVTQSTYTYEAYNDSIPYLMTHPLLKPLGDKPYILSFDQARLKRLYIDGRLQPEPVLLSTIVSDICLREGLVAGDIDVTQLTDLVDGYIVPRQMTGRAAIEPLQTAYYFDAVESDDKIKFVKRGAAPAVTIPQDDRAAHEHGQAMPDALSIVRAFELELPYQCDVEYPDVNADHLIGNQYDRRITKATKRKINLQLPIVMTAAKAKEVARATLYQAWLNQTYRWSTSRKYAKYEPTDVVNVPSDSANYSAMITAKREHPNGVIEWEGRMTAIEVYAQSGSDASPTNYAPQTVFNPSPTVLALLDMPLLRDEDDNAGFYVAMGGAL